MSRSITMFVPKGKRSDLSFTLCTVLEGVSKHNSKKLTTFNLLALTRMANTKFTPTQSGKKSCMFAENFSDHFAITIPNVFQIDEFAVRGSIEFMQNSLANWIFFS